jgi:hypothetical protein
VDRSGSSLLNDQRADWTQAFQISEIKSREKPPFFLLEKAIFLFCLKWNQLWATKPRKIFFGFPEEHMTSQTIMLYNFFSSNLTYFDPNY